MCIAGIARCGLPACENRKTNGKDTNRSHQYRQPARSVQWIAHRDAGRRPWLRTVLWSFLPYFHALEGLTRSTRLHKVFPVALGPAFVQLSVQLQRALQPKIRLQKGLTLNELVQCRRRVGVFEAFTMAESVLQLGLQKMRTIYMYTYAYKSSAAHASAVSRANHRWDGASEKVGSHQLLASVSCRTCGTGGLVLSPDSQFDACSLEGESTQQMARVPERLGWHCSFVGFLWSALRASLA